MKKYSKSVKDKKDYLNKFPNDFAHIKIKKLTPSKKYNIQQYDKSLTKYCEKKVKDFIKNKINRDDISNTFNKLKVNIVKIENIKKILINENNIKKNKRLELFKNNYVITKKINLEIIHKHNEIQKSNIAIQTEEFPFQKKSFYFNINGYYKKKNNILIKINEISMWSYKNSKYFNNFNKKVNNNKFEIIPNNEKIINNFSINFIKENYFPKGLENYTLNCYMNSLLQCLYYIRDFRNFFLTQKFKKSMTMCESMKDLMIGLSAINNKKFYIPKKIKNEIKKEEIFCDGKGGDAADLLSCIFDKITTELEKEESSITVEYETNVEDEFKMYQSLYKEIDFKTNVINKFFLGFYEKEYKCKKGHCKYSFQSEYRIVFPLEDISKNIKKNTNLNIYDCFDYYQRIQLNESNNKDMKSEDSQDNDYNNEDFENEEEETEKCSKCNENYVLREKIFRSPKILIILLDRGPNKKYDKTIEFYKYIDLNKYIKHNKYEYSKKYQLIGVSTHLGSCGDFGHYISFCLCDDNEYYCFNDKNVAKVVWNSKAKQYNCFYEGSPYILFYQRIGKSKKEKIFIKIINSLKDYIEDLIKKIDKIENNIKFTFNANKLKYIINNERTNNLFEFKLDLSEFNNSSKIKILVNDINVIDGIKENIINEYKWNVKISFEENEAKIQKLINHYFKKIQEKDCLIF